MSKKTSKIKKIMKRDKRDLSKAVRKKGKVMKVTDRTS